MAQIMTNISTNKNPVTGKKNIGEDISDSLPHIFFLTATIPLDFETEGHSFHYFPIDPNKPDLEKILVLVCEDRQLLSAEGAA